MASREKVQEVLAWLQSQGVSVAISEQEMFDRLKDAPDDLVDPAQLGAALQNNPDGSAARDTLDAANDQYHRADQQRVIANDPVQGLSVSQFSQGDVDLGAVKKQLKDYFASENIPLDEQQKIIQRLSQNSQLGSPGDFLQAAKTVNFNDATPEQQAQWKPVQGDLGGNFQSWAGQFKDHSGYSDLNTGDLTKALSGISDPAAKYKANQLVQQWVNSHSGVLAQMPSQRDINDLLGQVNQITGSQNPAPPATASTATTSTDQPSTLPDHSGQQAVAGGGSAALTSNALNPTVTQDDWASVGYAMGYASSDAAPEVAAQAAQAAQAAEAQAWQNAAQSHRNLHRAGEDGSAAPLPAYASTDPATWIQQQKSNAYGEFSWVIDLYAQDWQTAHLGANMPADLRAKLYQALAGAGLDLKAALRNYQLHRSDTNYQPQGVLEQELFAGSAGNQGILNLPVLSTVVSDYATTYSDAAAIAQMQSKAVGGNESSRVSDWVKTFGNKPLPADANTWQNMTEAQWTAFMGNQPYQGTTYANFNDSRTRIKSQWEDAFGVAPSDGVVASMVGKSGQEVTDLINGQPSRVGGMTYGQYSAVRKAGDTMSQTLFGGPMDDHMVSALAKQGFGT